MKKVIYNNLLMMKYVVRFCPNQIFFTILSAVLSNVIIVWNILYMRYIINVITKEPNIKRIIVIVLAFVFINIIYQYLEIWINQIVLPKNVQKLKKKMQIIIFQKAVEVDLECYEDAEFYDNYTLALEQADDRALQVLDTFSGMVGSLFGIGAFVTLISTFDPLVLVFVFLNVLISFLINLRVIKVSHDYYEETIPFQRKTDYVKRILYQREYAKELRLFREFSGMLKDKFSHAIDNRIKLVDKYGRKIGRHEGIQSIFNSGFNGMVMVYLAYGVIKQFINVADFIALSDSSNQLGHQITRFISVFPQMYEHSIYIENFKEFMDYSPKIFEPKEKKEISHCAAIELKNVSFSYPKTERLALKDINIKINPGEKVAFVGRNGSGKSTLIKLITRLYNPDFGNIFWGNCDYRECGLSDLRENIGVLTQDYQMYAVTIAENVLMRPIGNREQDMQLVEQALKYVGLYDKVMSFKDGVDTILTREFMNDGEIMSGGEFQKLAIARIYAKSCDVVILDEPSSALDPITENEVFDFVLDLANDKTVILITHKLSNVINVDKIFYLEDGCIVEEGSHVELMAKNGKYSAMFLAQAEKYV